MPQGFAFPSPPLLGAASPDRHRLQPGSGPGLLVFGRLADGFSMSDARAELTTVGDQMAAVSPDTH